MKGNAFSSLIGIRGGTGVIYNNTATITNGQVNQFTSISYFRSSKSYSPWGQCPSVYDLNATRCVDQTGVGKGIKLSGDPPAPQGWPSQVNDPAYDWNNLLNGTIRNTASDVPSVVQENRDFFHSVKPGYQAFTYPHPLTTGSSVSGTKPDPPQNLVVTVQ